MTLIIVLAGVLLVSTLLSVMQFVGPEFPLITLGLYYCIISAITIFILPVYIQLK